MRIGLLLCDEVPEQNIEEFGDYTSFFRDCFAAVAPEMVIVPILAYQSQLPERVDAFDGYLISGSQFSVYEERDWMTDCEHFVRKVAAAQIPVVGICFGHQLLAKAMGGRVQKADQGWGLGLHTHRMNENHELGKAGEPFPLLVFHQDQVVDLPDNFSALAGSDFCPNFVISNGAHLLGVQGHPEFSKEYCSRRVEQSKVLPEQDRKAALENFEGGTVSHEVLTYIHQVFEQHQ